MKKFLLDTSIIIDFLRSKDKTSTIHYRLAKEKLFTSILTYTELFAGKSVWEKKQARQELETIFTDISILPLNKTTAEKAGFFKATYKNLYLVDAIIAATAITENIQLVTLNTKDFAQIKEIKLFSPE